MPKAPQSAVPTPASLLEDRRPRHRYGLNHSATVAVPPRERTGSARRRSATDRRQEDAGTTLNVLGVSTSDQGGGAERIAWTLLKGLQQRGHRSWLAVGQKKTEDDAVIPFYLSPHIDYRPYSATARQWWLAKRKQWDAFWGIEDYRHPYSHHMTEIAGQRPDVVHLHNLHGGYFDLHAAARISQEIPTFVTLEDCWWFSGHCAYSLGCDRWETGCGECPLLQVAPGAKRRDATRYNWQVKQAIYRKSRFFVASPSRWLLDRAERSMFQPAMVESRVIPHGVDLQRFRPGEKAAAREALGLPPNAFVAMFAAKGTESNPFKDYETVRAAVAQLASEVDADQEVWLLAVGEQGSTQRVGRAHVRQVPFVLDPAEMATYYQASDVYLHAAKDEAFGIVIAEALACGLPVVATAVGGIPEVFVDGQQGFHVPPGDAASMAHRARLLAEDSDLHRSFSQRAALHASRHYDDRLMVQRYLNWYQAVIPSSEPRGRGGLA